jgi:S1-C subfamily serine protease
MKIRLVALLSVVLIPVPAGAAEAPSLSEVFKRVDDSVVVVRTREKNPLPSTMTEAASVAGLGSGVLISDAGEVLTAAHVVQAADEVGVEFVGGEIIRAKVISSEPAADVALLRLDRMPRGRIPVAALGDSDKVEVGEPIFVVGAPLGITHTLTAGHISARRRPKATLGGMSLAEFFQTDAAINQGNSGGPMFNMAGQVIGVVSHIISRSGGSEGLGFAVTSNLARQVLLEEKSVWSGLDGYLLSGDLARVFNLPPPGVGMLVQRIAERSPSAARPATTRYARSCVTRSRETRSRSSSCAGGRRWSSR